MNDKKKRPGRDSEKFPQQKRPTGKMPVQGNPQEPQPDDQNAFFEDDAFAEHEMEFGDKSGRPAAAPGSPPDKEGDLVNFVPDGEKSEPKQDFASNTGPTRSLAPSSDDVTQSIVPPKSEFMDLEFSSGAGSAEPGSEFHKPPDIELAGRKPTEEMPTVAQAHAPSAEEEVFDLSFATAPKKPAKPASPPPAEEEVLDVEVEAEPEIPAQPAPAAPSEPPVEEIPLEFKEPAVPAAESPIEELADLSFKKPPTEKDAKAPLEEMKLRTTLVPKGAEEEVKLALKPDAPAPTAPQKVKKTSFGMQKPGAPAPAPAPAPKKDGKTAQPQKPAQQLARKEPPAAPKEEFVPPPPRWAKPEPQPAAPPPAPGVEVRGKRPGEEPDAVGVLSHSELPPPPAPPDGYTPPFGKEHPHLVFDIPENEPSFREKRGILGYLLVVLVLAIIGAVVYVILYPGGVEKFIADIFGAPENKRPAGKKAGDGKSTEPGVETAKPTGKATIEPKETGISGETGKPTGAAVVKPIETGAGAPEITPPPVDETVKIKIGTKEFSVAKSAEQAVREYLKKYEEALNHGTR
jgi:hypothetical protein